MTVDADGDVAGVQAARVLTTTDDFTITLPASDAATSTGYQWELQWDDETLDFVSAVENTTETGATLCSPVSRNESAPSGKEWQGGGAGCLSTGSTMPATVTLTTITLKCNVTTGVTTEIHLVSGGDSGEDPVFGTLFFAGGNPQPPASRIDAQVTCGAP